MVPFRAIAIPESVASEVRASLRSPGYGHPAYVSLANGHGPCRSCLHVFREGEEDRILFTYDAFRGVESYPEPGPIYVHVEPCRRHEGVGFPPGLRGVALTLEAFGPGRHLVRREHLDGRDPDRVAGELLALPEVLYVNVRNTDAGCFVARLEPVLDGAA